MIEIAIGMIGGFKRRAERTCRREAFPSVKRWVIPGEFSRT